MTRTFFLFFLNDTPTTEIYTLSLHDALPILKKTKKRPHITVCKRSSVMENIGLEPTTSCVPRKRSEEHTSELQSRFDLVCRLLLEKKKKYHLIDNLYYHTDARPGPTIGEIIP